MKRALLIVWLLAGFGGCGSSPLPPSDNSPHTLRWDPPAKWEDNSYMDPRHYIREFNVYACDNLADLIDDLLPCATVAGVDNEARVATFFDLWVLAPYGITPPKVISIKAVSVDNMVSKYADPVLWSEE